MANNQCQLKSGEEVRAGKYSHEVYFPYSSSTPPPSLKTNAPEIVLKNVTKMLLSNSSKTEDNENISEKIDDVADKKKYKMITSAVIFLLLAVFLVGFFMTKYLKRKYNKYNDPNATSTEINEIIEL